MSQEPEYFSHQVTETRRWFLGLPKARAQALVVVSVGCERCLPEYRVERGDFNLFCLEFVAEGEGRLRLGEEGHKLGPGSAFTYGPGVSHRIENTSARPMLKYFVDCGGVGARKLFQATGFDQGRAVRVRDGREPTEMFEMLLRNAMNESPQSPRVCAALMEALLVKVAEQAVAGPVADSRAWATFQRVRRHMQAHFLELRTMQEIARGTHVDAAYLSRLFRRFHATSPYQYLARLKMNHAASRLLSPNTLVKEVAAELGFSDAFHFSRSFKAVHGLSPEQFRRQGPQNPNPSARSKTAVS